MNTPDTVFQVAVEDDFIELDGTVLRQTLTVQQLSDALGTDYREVPIPGISGMKNWVWDHLGITVMSFPRSIGDHDSFETSTVRHIYFHLRVCGWTGSPSASLPGPLKLFGLIWNSGDDPHRFVRNVLNQATHLGFHGTTSHVPSARRETNDLRNGGRLTIIDPTLHRAQGEEAQEVAICYELPIRARLGSDVRVHSEPAAASIPQASSHEDTSGASYFRKGMMERYGAHMADLTLTKGFWIAIALLLLILWIATR